MDILRERKEVTLRNLENCATSCDLETLAKELHEAGRAAVEAGATVAAEKFGEQTRKFIEWSELSETARDGRRIQARYLLSKFFVIVPERAEMAFMPSLVAYEDEARERAREIAEMGAKINDKNFALDFVAANVPNLPPMVIAEIAKGRK